MKIKAIETERLILRCFEKEDALWAYSIWNNPEMGAFLPDEAKEGIDEVYIKQLEALGEDDECCYLIPIFKETKERVGTCSFIPNNTEMVYDLAYCVHKQFWNKGYATEIVIGMMNYARECGAKSVTILINPNNIASVKVAIKCGGQKVDENTYKKRGTDIVMTVHKYEINL